jgi:hypothetical protein
MGQQAPSASLFRPFHPHSVYDVTLYALYLQHHIDLRRYSCCIYIFELLCYLRVPLPICLCTRDVLLSSSAYTDGMDGILLKLFQG